MFYKTNTLIFITYLIYILLTISSHFNFELDTDKVPFNICSQLPITISANNVQSTLKKKKKCFENAGFLHILHIYTLHFCWWKDNITSIHWFSLTRLADAGGPGGEVPGVHM